MNRFKSFILAARWPLALAALVTLRAPSMVAAPANDVRFTPSARSVDTYEFLEVRIDVPAPRTGNPFKDVEVTGEFAGEDGVRHKVDGFCDSDNGSVFRIRFMPAQPGRHVYSVSYRASGGEKTFRGQFNARRSGNKGLVRVDKAHPFHFMYEGTGEHYFWNATTTYALIGWRDEAVIRESIDRLAKLRVNRLRVAIIPPRVKGGVQWFEPAITNEAHFTFCVNAWPAARPESVDDPGFDTARGYGGWINGRGNDEMTMLKGYARTREFFEGMEWWKLEPAPEVIAPRTAYCLAQAGVNYVAYLPKGGSVALKIAPGEYKARWFNPRTGKSNRIGTVKTDAWISPSAPDTEDWVLQLVGVR